MAISRRTFVRANAWSVPVLALAMAVPAAVVSTPTGTLAFNPVQYRGTLSPDGTRVDFPDLTGIITVSGVRLPTTVSFAFSAPSPGRVDLRYDGDHVVTVIPIDATHATFTISGVYNAIVGGDNPFGFIYAYTTDDVGVNFGNSVAELDG